MKAEIVEDAVFGEDTLNFDNLHIPFDRRLYSELVYKMIRFESTLADNETVGMQIGDVVVDVKEFALIPNSGFVKIFGIRLESAEIPRKPVGIFLSVLPITQLCLTLLALQREESESPRRPIGFSHLPKIDFVEVSE